MNQFIRNIFRDNPVAKHQQTVLAHQLIKNGEVTSKVATFNYAWLDQNASFEPHSHKDGIEYFLILEGIGRIKISYKDNKIDEKISKGDFITLPPNATHSIHNTSKNRLVFITLRTLLFS